MLIDSDVSRRHNHRANSNAYNPFSLSSSVLPEFWVREHFVDVSLRLVSTTLHCDWLWFLCGLSLLQKEVSLMWGEDYIICGCKDNCLD